MVEINTEHCLIREITLDDMEGLFHLYDQPGVTDYIEPLYEWDEEVEYRRLYIENIYNVYGFGIWGVFLKSTGEMIGQNGFEYREGFTWDTADLGYVIDPKYRRQGYCRETTEAVIAYAKEHTALDYLQARIRDDNKASIHICTGFGFIPTSRMSDDERIYLKPLWGGEVADAIDRLPE